MSDAPETPTKPYEEALLDWCTSPRLDALTTLVVHILRHHWSDPDNQINDNLRGISYSTPTTTSSGTTAAGKRDGIVIDKAGHFKLDTANQRPAIFVRRGNFDFQRISIGDRLHFQHELTGEEEFVRLCKGAVSVQALAQTELMSEALGLEVERQLLHFSSGIADDAGLHRFSPLGVGETKISEDYKPLYSTAIPIEIAFEEHWVVTPQGPLLRTISYEPTVE